MYALKAPAADLTQGVACGPFNCCIKRIDAPRCWSCIPKRTFTTTATIGGHHGLRPPVESSKASIWRRAGGTPQQRRQRRQQAARRLRHRLLQLCASPHRHSPDSTFRQRGSIGHLERRTSWASPSAPAASRRCLWGATGLRVSVSRSRSSRKSGEAPLRSIISNGSKRRYGLDEEFLSVPHFITLLRNLDTSHHRPV